MQFAAALRIKRRGSHPIARGDADGRRRVDAFSTPSNEAAGVRLADTVLRP
jgi:hypothetical protein